jgi:DNA-binding IclR family transcriptional regulator
MTSPRGTTPPLSSGLKLLALLSCIADTTEPVRIAELARRLDVPRGAVHRQLVTLAAGGWVHQVEDGRYQLSMRAVSLGQAAFNHAGLSRRTMLLLRDLAESVGEVASLAILDDLNVRIVQRVEPGLVLRGVGALGARFSVWDSASGRVIVATADPGLTATLRQRGAELPGDEELVAIREAGYSAFAPDDEAMAVAVPVAGGRGGAPLALSVIGPRDRIDLNVCLPALRSTAAAVEAVVAAAADLGAADADWAASSGPTETTAARPAF